MGKKLIIKLALFITFLFFATGSISVASNSGNPNVYFDTKTGHKYIENIDHSFTEYSQKGKLLKNNVSPDLPLLVKSKNIKEVKSDSWFLYETSINQSLKRKILPAANNHPMDWRCKGLLAPQLKEKKLTKLGLGYTTTPETIKYNGQELFAFGMAYYDSRTGHKYLKNSNNTYSEFAKKGKLLRTDVRNNLPLLTSGKTIFDLNTNDFILYEKKVDGQLIQQILNAMADHPKNWYPKQIFISVR